MTATEDPQESLLKENPTTTKVQLFDTILLNRTWLIKIINIETNIILSYSIINETLFPKIMNLFLKYQPISAILFKVESIKN